MISVHFQGKPFNITVIQSYAPTSNAEEAEVEWFYEDLEDLLELTTKKDVLLIIGDWNAKLGSQEIPRETGKFGLAIQNEGFPGGSDDKASACNVGDPGSIPGSGRSPGEGNGNPLQYSCLENSMEGGSWCFLSTFLLCCCRRLQDPLVYSLPLPWNQPFL